MCNANSKRRLVFIALLLIDFASGGYDIFPRTHLGRFICALCAFWGVCITPLLFVTLSNILNISSLGSKAYIVLHRLKKKDEAKVHSVHVVGSVMKEIQRAKKTGTEPRDMKSLYRQHLKEIRKAERYEYIRLSY